MVHMYTVPLKSYYSVPLYGTYVEWYYAIAFVTFVCIWYVLCHSCVNGTYCVITHIDGTSQET